MPDGEAVLEGIPGAADLSVLGAEGAAATAPDTPGADAAPAAGSLETGPQAGEPTFTAREQQLLRQHEENQRFIGRQAEELGTMRQLLEQLAAQQQQAAAQAAQPAGPDPAAEKQQRLVDLYQEHLTELQTEGEDASDEAIQQRAAARARRELARQEHEEEKWEKRFGRMEETFSERLEQLTPADALLPLVAPILQRAGIQGVDADVVRDLHESGVRLTAFRQFSPAQQAQLVTKVGKSIAYDKLIANAGQPPTPPKPEQQTALPVGPGTATAAPQPNPARMRETQQARDIGATLGFEGEALDAYVRNVLRKKG